MLHCNRLVGENHPPTLYPELPRQGEVRRQAGLEEFFPLGVARGGFGDDAPLFVTETELAPGSTVQPTLSPSSIPSMATTASGMVVRRDSDRLSDRIAALSKVLAIDSPLTLTAGRVNNYGLHVGLPVGKHNVPFCDVGLRGCLQMAKGMPGADSMTRGRALAAHKGSVTAGGDGASFVVIDTRDQRRHLVLRRDSDWACSCTSSVATQRAGLCPHIWAVKFTLSRPPASHSVIPARSLSTKDPTDRYHAYTEGQKAEFRWFDPLLVALLEGIPEPQRIPRRAGRPPTPLKEALFVAVKKAHERLSCRRLVPSIEEATARGRLPRVPNYSVPARTLGRPEMTPLLIFLIRESAKPLIDLESGGTVAIDSSGFTTSTFGTYLTETHQPHRRHEFVKAHIAIGTRTHIVTDLVVTSNRGADSPQFGGLVKGTLEGGFTPSMVVADKAYLSRANYELVQKLGMEARIPFRSNVGPSPKGVRVWKNMWHYFQLHRQEFDLEYHRRSNVEAVFSAIKRKLGESLFSRSPVARQNELLCKVLSYNLGIVIAEMTAHGIDPSGLFRSPGGGDSRPIGPPVEPTGDIELELVHPDIGGPVESVG